VRSGWLAVLLAGVACTPAQPAARRPVEPPAPAAPSASVEPSVAPTPPTWFTISPLTHDGPRQAVRLAPDEVVFVDEHDFPTVHDATMDADARGRRRWTLSPPSTPKTCVLEGPHILACGDDAWMERYVLRPITDPERVAKLDEVVVRRRPAPAECQRAWRCAPRVSDALGRLTVDFVAVGSPESCIEALEGLRAQLTARNLPVPPDCE
jgi:hypothetical protein